MNDHDPNTTDLGRAADQPADPTTLDGGVSETVTTAPDPRSQSFSPRDEKVRRGQVIRLLEHLNDGLPTPRRREGSATSGFVNLPSPRSCPDCLANDHPVVGCETCGGSGIVPLARLASIALPDSRDDDGQPRDAYAVEKVQPYGMDPTRHDRARERDAEIDRLSAQTREPFASPADELADANRNPYRWERERAALWQRYDYAALVAALELLRDRDPAACSVLHGVYVYGWTEPSAAVEALVDRGLAFIEDRMPDPIRAPGDPEHPAERRQRRRAA